MTDTPFNRMPQSDVQKAEEELEAERTVGLSRVLPADPPDEIGVEQDVEPVEAASQHDYLPASQRPGVDGLMPIKEVSDQRDFDSGFSGEHIPQAPGRMVSPKPGRDKAGVEALVEQGVTREAAEDSAEDLGVADPPEDHKG